MKLCTTCGHEKPDDAFARGGSTPTGLQGKCKVCHQVYIATRTEERRVKVNAIKRETGCMDCGEQPEDIHRLEFHHRHEETKEFNVGHGLTKAWKRIEKEINKCDVVCRQCHKTRHAHARRNRT
jgi:hypothetical protein